MEIPFNYNRGDKELTLANGACITGCTSQEPDGILGLSDYSGFVLDEAGYCCEQLYLNACDRLRRSKYFSKNKINFYTKWNSN